MSQNDDAVVRVRVAVITAMQFAGPEATEAVLKAIAPIPYRGNLDAYLQEVIPVIKDTAEKALQPQLEAHREATRIAARRAAELDAQTQKFWRELEEFKQMKTPKTPDGADILH